MHHTRLHKAILILTGVAGVVHLWIGWRGNDWLLILNGIGFLVLFAALIIPYTSRPRYHDLVRGVLLVYTLVTFVGYFIVHGGIPIVYAHGESDHTTTTAETAVDNDVDSGDTIEVFAGGEQLAVNGRPDYAGLSVKGVELLLLIVLIADIVENHRRQRLRV